jgi:hypothetical protein
MRTILAPVLALLLLVPTAGCGGGGSSETTLTFVPTTDLTLFSDGSAQAAGGLRVGDTAANLSVRSAVRFGIFLFIPSGAVITSAKLRFQQAGVQGNPYGLGTVVVDRADFGGALDAGDFNPVILAPNVGTLSTNATLEGKEVDVTAAVIADVAAADFTSDFLLRFTSALSANATADLAAFEDSENSMLTGGVVTLVVTYQ